MEAMGKVFSGARKDLVKICTKKEKKGAENTAATPPPITDGGQMSSTLDTATPTTDSGQMLSTSDTATPTTDDGQTSSTSDTATPTTDSGQIPSTSDTATPTTDGGQTSSIPVVNTTYGPQSASVRSGDTPANTTNNQGLPAAGSDHTSEATANQPPPVANGTDRQQNSANPGALPANELSPPPNGPDCVAGDSLASDSDNNSTQQRASINNPSAPVEQGDGQTKTGEETDQREGTGDPLADTILDCLDLLEGLSRCLDKEYKYGSCKCWKHVAERFGVKEQVYQNFNCSQVQSPTEVMFDYLQTQCPDITIGYFKDKLHSIERDDVVTVLVEYERDYATVDNSTLVCSLFDSDSDIIGEIAFLLDMQKKGVKNWSHLAASLNIPRRKFKTFETGNTDCPAAEELFKLVQSRCPRTTVGELISHLEKIERRDVIVAIRKCTTVTEDSLLKELMEEDNVMENVCELLNQKQRTKTVKTWSHLGRQYGIEKKHLDDLLPSHEEIVRPTEALIRHLGGSKPHLKIADLIRAIHLIDRDDVLEVLGVYLQNGCIANVLRLCDCKRCEKAREQEKGLTDGL